MKNGWLLLVIWGSSRLALFSHYDGSCTKWILGVKVFLEVPRWASIVFLISLGPRAFGSDNQDPRSPRRTDLRVVRALVWSWEYTWWSWAILRIIFLKPSVREQETCYNEPGLWPKSVTLCYLYTLEGMFGLGTFVMAIKTSRPSGFSGVLVGEELYPLCE